MVFTWIDWNAVEEAGPVGVTSDTTKTASPSRTIPFAFRRLTDLAMSTSMSSVRSTNSGMTPHCRFRAMRVLSSFVNANMGEFGRLRESRDAMCPCFVYTKIASTPRLSATIQGTIMNRGQDSTELNVEVPYF